MDNAHFNKLEDAYHSAKINRIPYKDSVLKVEGGKATLTYPVSSDFFHKMEALHGSVYFKMLDDAAFFAVNSLVKDVFVLTTSFSIDLIRPVTAGTLTAKAWVSFESRNLWVAESELFDHKMRKVAMGKGRFTQSKIPL